MMVSTSAQLRPRALEPMMPGFSISLFVFRWESPGCSRTQLTTLPGPFHKRLCHWANAGIGENGDFGLML